MSELQFMLFEAFSNVLQHSHARTLAVEGFFKMADGVGRVFVRVVDDGCGFDPEQRSSKGLSSMRERAAAIGAKLNIRSKPGHTVLEIQLDV